MSQEEDMGEWWEVLRQRGIWSVTMGSGVVWLRRCSAVLGLVARRGGIFKELEMFARGGGGSSKVCC